MIARVLHRHQETRDEVLYPACWIIGPSLRLCTFVNCLLPRGVANAKSSRTSSELSMSAYGEVVAAKKATRAANVDGVIWVYILQQKFLGSCISAD